MDILILARDDWANVGWLFQEALKRADVDALAVKLREHPFNYAEQAQVVSEARMRELAKDAKAILFMHSQRAVLDLDLSNKFVAVFHGGSAYRRNAQELNKIFNPIVDATIVQTGDLLDLGAERQYWIIPPVDTSRLITCHAWTTTLDPVIVAHYPRHPQSKNSEVIDRVVNKLVFDTNIFCKWEYRTDKTVIPWSENMDRMARCDIYIESHKLVDDFGNRVCEWGVTTLEAAALGDIVVTVFGSKDRYEKEYGECPLVVANSEEELEERLRWLLSPGYTKRIRRIQRETKEWVSWYHSFEAVGVRLRKIFEPCL